MSVFLKTGVLLMPGTDVQSKTGNWYVFRGIAAEPTAAAFGKIRVTKLYRRFPHVVAPFDETFAETAFRIEFR